MTRQSWGAAGLVLALALSGCGEAGETPAPQSQPAQQSAPAPTQAAPKAAPGGAAAAEAAQIFATRCSPCHGSDGSGSGPASQGLTPPPRDLRDPAWQASVGDDHITNIIKYGGAAVGLSPSMPGNPDLMGKPEVLAELVATIRGLQAQ